ncbi:ABC transporter substrate-binding protein/permease [Gordonia hankookensis]|uniref:ABC transporter permease subunit n=1 Tax=Gordonia hankookensis TaxID=589403 RepID=A0ABR7W8Q6_9ACTN|nr:ABC transporter substrate-binding protein/permease [Gordonia hankookensis]MBD1318901.1 ABC transporter permease subunit [Gordonia hankookensis]NDZ94421.1 ABC transporter permease subunit [Streptomyces sp. SID11726]NEB24929.1 ABC transporter permease subunit [Streptomyces sp. SID6673]
MIGLMAAVGGAAPPAAAAPPDSCTPAGAASASAAPTNMAAADQGGEDRYTTATTTPVDQIDTNALGLLKPGTISVGTLSDAGPSICVNGQGVFTGFDNELLKAVAAKLGLQIQFSGTEFAGLLSQVANNRFDVGSSSITTTDERRKTVDFTNGYDFGYFSLVAPTSGSIKSFSDLSDSTRIGVVQGTVQDDYVINTLKLDPVKFPDYATAYANLKSGQIDAWVAPSQQAEGAVKDGDGTAIVENTFSVNNFVAWAVGKNKPELVAALNSGLDAIIADGTYAKLYTDWVPRELPDGWKPGSKAAPEPKLPDFAAIAKENEAENAGKAEESTAPKGTFAQLGSTFFNWDLYRESFPDLIKTGLVNTLILSLVSGVLGTIIGMLLAVAGISRSRWLRWPARVYTDIFRGLPAVVVILLVGLGVGPVVKNLTGNNPYWLGAVALALLAAAYIGEIFRSGIQSVDDGQMEASRAIGFSYRQSMRLVVIPQGVRRVLPALMNQFISLIKDSSLVYFLGLLASQRELFAVGRDLNAQTGNLSPLVAAGIVYLVLTIPLTHLVNHIDNRLRTGRPADVEDDPLPVTAVEKG